VKDALDYLVGEKLRTFAGAARHDAAFARELPRFLAAVWRLFNERSFWRSRRTKLSSSA
jgi:hypothetical protein